MNMTFSRIIVLIVTIILIGGIIIHLLNSGREVVISTATTLYATGLLDYIAEKFNEEYPEITLKFIPLGTGAALESAARGDADLVLTHAPSLEKEYLDKGIIYKGKIIAYNYFIVVGPRDDPANISSLSNIEDVFRKIYELGEEGKIKFLSRGDLSGTHIRELMIWDSIGLNPDGDWYVESGSGMGETLLIANELSAYTLSDIGTYRIFKGKDKIENLTILFENDVKLLNIYSIYMVKGRETKEAMIFYNYLLNNIEKLINGFNQENGDYIFYPVSSYEGNLRELWYIFSEGRLP